MYKTNRTTINRNICTSLVLLGSFCSAVVFAKEGEKHMSFQQDVASADVIRLHVPAGDVDIVGITGNNLMAEVTAVCKDGERQACQRLLQGLDWTKRLGRSAEFSLMPDSASSFNPVTIKVKIGVPQNKKLEVKVSAGEVSITDTSACLTADLNAGELNIALKENQLGSAALKAMVGDVKMTRVTGEQISGRRSVLVGAKLALDKGAGECHTQAKVLAGEVHLTLK